MSLTCQYEQLISSHTSAELSREVMIETKLKIPETVPKIDTIIGGSIQLGLPVVSVNDNYNLIQITGKICPEIFYAGMESNELSGNYQRPDYSGVYDEQNQSADPNDFHREPKEHSYQWSGDNGVIYEERIEVPDWQASNAVEVKVVPKNCDFERIGPDQIGLSARILLIIQPTAQEQNTIISDLVVQPPENVNILKDQIMIEQLSAVKQVQLPVQASLQLPGLKPAISRVLGCHARAYDLSWEYNRGKIYLKGLLDVGLVYVGLDDDDLPTEIMANEWNRDSGNPVTFETHFDTEIPAESLLVVPSVSVININAAIKSRREIQCLVNLDCQVAISRIQTGEIVTGVVPGPGTLIDIQKGQLKFEEYVGEAAGEFSFEFSADLPAGQPGADRLLTCQGQFMEPTVEATDGSAAVEGNLNLVLLYTADGPGGPELHIAHWESRHNNQFPVAGMIDFPNIHSGSLIRIQTSLESLKTELVNERSLKISGQVKVRLWARNPRLLSILEDCAEVIPVDPETRPSMLFYIVQPGDTLWKIARRYQTTMENLIQSNQITNPDRIEAGRKLLIPKQAG